MILLDGNRCHHCDDLIEAHAVFCLGCLALSDLPASVVLACSDGSGEGVTPVERSAALSGSPHPTRERDVNG